MAYYDAALIDASVLEDPRLLRLPRSTRLMQIEAYVWSRRHRTDGNIPRHVLARFSFDAEDARAAAQSLVDVGLWEPTDDGWQITEFLNTQMSRARVEKIRGDNRARFERYSERHPRQRSVQRVSNATEGTRPDPTRPGKGGAGGYATSPAFQSDLPADQARPAEERIAVAQAILADSSASPIAKRAASRQLYELGVPNGSEQSTPEPKVGPTSA